MGTIEQVSINKETDKEAGIMECWTDKEKDAYIMGKLAYKMGDKISPPMLWTYAARRAYMLGVAVACKQERDNAEAGNADHA